MEKAPDAFRTISEVAEEINVPQHVLRFWESRFTQIKPLKRGGGRRYYRPDDVDLLRGVRHLLYGEGYTIRGVQRILREEGLSFVQGVWRAGAEPPPPKIDEDQTDEDREDAADDQAWPRAGQEPSSFGPAPRIDQPSGDAAPARREPCWCRRRQPSPRMRGSVLTARTGANFRACWRILSPAEASSTLRSPTAISTNPPDRRSDRVRASARHAQSIRDGFRRPCPASGGGRCAGSAPARSPWRRTHWRPAERLNRSRRR